MRGDVISDEQAEFFLENGYLILRDVLLGEELSRLRQAAAELTEYGTSEVRTDADFAYGAGHLTGAPVLRRIEYVIDKRDEYRALLGHPYILRSVEKLMGRDFIPTWDSMVLKLPSQGIVVPWHRDAGTEFVGDKPIFNVDFYLDDADENTCVWLIPGSHRWQAEAAREEIERRNSEFTTNGAIPALMKPGDVLLHDILVLHGSPSNTSSNIRRVVYFEFRTAHVEEALGPHIPSYIPLKQRVLLNCIDVRKRYPFANDEAAYDYRPPAPYDRPAADGCVAAYRVPHEEYWVK